MTTKLKVRCINKDDRYSPFERITHIAGVTAYNGANWKITQEEAIRDIQSGKWAFFVVKNGQPVDVIVATSRFGNKYLKTVADGEEPNNLLSLMECAA